MQNKNLFVPQVEGLEEIVVPSTMRQIEKPVNNAETQRVAQYGKLPPKQQAAPYSWLRRMAEKVYSDCDDRREFLEVLGESAQRTRKDGEFREFKGVCRALLKLFNSKHTFVSIADRRQLAYEVLYFTAHPDLVNQGGYPTCVPTAFNGALFFERPSLAADVIVESVKRGVFTSPIDGKKVLFTFNNFLAPYKGDTLIEPGEQERTFAVQLLNTAFLNDIGRQAFKYVTIDKLAVGHHAALLYVTDPTGQVADHWVDYNGNMIAWFEGAYAPDFSPVGQAWIGGLNTLYSADYYVQVDGSNTFGSRDQFAQQLQQIILGKGLTVTLVVSSKEIGEHFKPQWNPGPIEAQQDHLVTVTAYDVASNSAYLNNSWGPDYDAWLPLDTLYDIAVYSR
jgi:hypothetical protein